MMLRTLAFVAAVACATGSFMDDKALLVLSDAALFDEAPQQLSRLVRSADTPEPEPEDAEPEPEESTTTTATATKTATATATATATKTASTDTTSYAVTGPDAPEPEPEESTTGSSTEETSTEETSTKETTAPGTTPDSVSSGSVEIAFSGSGSGSVNEPTPVPTAPGTAPGTNPNPPSSQPTAAPGTTEVKLATVVYAFDANTGAAFDALTVADLARDNKALGYQLMGVMNIAVTAYNEAYSGMQKDGALIVGKSRRRRSTYSFKVSIDTAQVSLADVNAAIATANAGTLPELTIYVGGVPFTYQVPNIPAATEETVTVTLAPVPGPAPAPTPPPTAVIADSATSVTIGWMTVLALALALL